MKQLLLLLITSFVTAASAAQTSASAKLPCTDPLYRQFDFWIGEWEAYNLKGLKAGDSKISLILDSYTILEEWTSANMQNGFRFSGKSYNMYNVAKKRWQQYWIDNTGGVVEYLNGKFENGKMIVETDNIEQPDKTWRIMRMIFSQLSPDKVRQLGENSIDAGKTWKTTFDLEYRRKRS